MQITSDDEHSHGCRHSIGTMGDIEPFEKAHKQTEIQVLYVGTKFYVMQVFFFASISHESLQ